MKSFLEELEKTGSSLMIYKNRELIFNSSSNGVRPYLEAIDKLGEVLNGSVIVDKIVGRAAALLIIYSKAREAYASVLSTPGKQILDHYKLPVTYTYLVEHIKMKDGRIYCPFESMVQGISDPLEAYLAILEKMNSFKSQFSS